MPLFIMGTETVCVILVLVDALANFGQKGTSTNCGFQVFYYCAVAIDLAIGAALSCLSWYIRRGSEGYIGQRWVAIRLLWTLRALCALILLLYAFCYWLAEDMRGRNREGLLTTAKLG